MTFDELNDKVVAIRATVIKFDYFNRTLHLIAVPEYGFSKYPELTNRKFNIEINDCMYFCGANTSKMANGNMTEFTSWGKHKENKCDKKYCNNLIESFLSKTPSGVLGKDSTMRRNLNMQYYHYFFQNVLGDAMDVLASEDIVEEIKEE